MANPTLRVLLADDQASESIIYQLYPFGIDLQIENDADRAAEIATAAGCNLDAVLLDLGFEGQRMQGEDVLAFIRERRKDLPVVIFTVRDSSPLRRDLLQRGAAAYVYKWREGIDFQEVAQELWRVVRAERHLRRLRMLEPVEGLLVGKSPASRTALNAIRNAARNAYPVLITGARGTGKTLFAAEIHRRGPQSREVPAAVDAFEDLDLERKLFESGPANLPALAAGASLIIERSEYLSHRLRRRIETALNTDEMKARVILTAEGILDHEAALFRRCKRILVPALRQRSADIPDLANFFLMRIDARRLAGSHRLTPAAVDYLQGLRFPGNLTELQGLLEEAAWRAPGDEIDVGALRPRGTDPWDPEQGILEFLNGNQSFDLFSKRFDAYYERLHSDHWDRLIEAARKLAAERKGRKVPDREIFGEASGRISARRYRKKKAGRWNDSDRNSPSA